MINSVHGDTSQHLSGFDGNSVNTFLRRLVDSMPDPVFVKDTKHRWLYLNKAFCEFIGYSAEEMLGKSDYDFFPKEQADVFWEKDALVFQTETDNINIEQVLDARGRTRVISTRKTLIVDENGEKLLVGSIRDISELNRMREHEHQVNRVLKTLALGGSHKDILTMILRLAEEQFDGMTASILTVDESGKRLKEVVPSRLPQYFRDVIDGTPIRDEMGACGTAAFRKERVITLDIQNHPYWHRVRELITRAGLHSCWSEPVIISDGRVVGTFALYYNEPKAPDKTEIQLMETMAQLAAITVEHQLMDEESTLLRKMLRNIIDSMPSVLIGVDPECTVTQWNSEAEKVTGIPAMKAVGRPLERVYPFIERDLLQDVRSAVGTGQVRPIMKNIRQSDGETLHEDITVYPLCSNGIEGAVIRIDDVTGRVRYEEAMIQADKMTSIGVLAGGIAHDFNNILVGIIGNLSLASQQVDPDDPVYSLIRKAEDASLRARGLANQLLTFSKGGAPVRQAADLDTLLKESTRFILSGSNVTCRHDVPEGLWTVDIDSDQIAQVIQNLVLNAKQAMVEGGRIDIRCTNVDKESQQLPPSLDGERYVMVEIRDHGPGIQKSLMERIFDPYFTTKQSGSGLGLAVCHSIISRHEGLLTIRSPVGKGTVFLFYLPAADESEVCREQEISDKPQSGQGRILIMDDEQVVHDVLREALAFFGYDVVSSYSGEEAIKVYREAMYSNSPIDLVIMDLTIPAGMGAKEAVCKILAVDPQAKVIVSSGYSNDPIVAQYEKYGFSAALVKPFQLTDVSNMVGRLLKD